ncbi:MAG: hypothetical protein LBI03_08925 [Clostridiales bacterium]|jgi:hypothetical protein|nr:hypothetical protein [Clostridiales bacterium]
MKKVKFLLIMFVFVIVFSSCQSSNTISFYSNASFLKVHTKEAHCFSFSLTLFSKNKMNKIDFINAEGLGFEQNELTVNITDITTDEVNRFKYKDFYAKSLLVEIKPIEKLDTISISAIILKVDNETHKITFTNSIEHEFSEGLIFSEDLEIRTIPNEFSSSVLEEGVNSSFVYEFSSQQDLTIEQIYCLDFFDAEISGIRIDDITIENASLPFEVKKGQNIAISILYKATDVTAMDYITTNLYFSYKTNQDVDSKENAVIVVFDPVYPIYNNNTSHINTIIDTLISEK